MAPTVAQLAHSCAQVQPLWSQLRLSDRARYLLRAAQAVVDELDELTGLLAAAHARTAGEIAALELLPAIDGLQWLAESGTRALGERRLAVPRGSHPLTRARERWDPVGVVAILSAADAPFAVPLWQVGAALLAGNGAVLVPEPRAARAAERIARLFARASLPEGLLAVAPDDRNVHEAAVARVYAPDLPGVAELVSACAARGVPVAVDVTRGGAALVLADAGVPRAAQGIANAAFAGGGRTRGAARRAWVVREVHDAWVARVVAAARHYPPIALDEGSIAADLLRDAVERGAQLRCGGPDEAGGFAPAVLTGVTEEMRVARERYAAPLLAVSTVASTGDAIAAANVAPLGAGASVWTASRYDGARIARELRAGPTWLNDHLLAPALPALPWGRGVGGEAGVRAFAQPRAVSWESERGRAAWWGPYDERVARAARAVVRLRSVRDPDRERGLREGALPIARVAARALRGRRMRR